MFAAGGMVAFTCTKSSLKTRMRPRGSAPLAKENGGSAAPGCHLSVLSQEGAQHGYGEICFSAAIFPGLPGFASLLRALGGDACGTGARSAARAAAPVRVNLSRSCCFSRSLRKF